MFLFPAFATAIILIVLIIYCKRYLRYFFIIIFLLFILKSIISQYELDNKFEYKIPEKLVLSTGFKNSNNKSVIEANYLLDLNTGKFKKYTGYYYSGSIIDSSDEKKHFSPSGKFYVQEHYLFDEKGNKLLTNFKTGFHYYKYWTQDGKYLIFRDLFYQKYFGIAQEFGTNAIFIIELKTGKIKQISPYQNNKRIEILDVIGIVK